MTTNGSTETKPRGPVDRIRRGKIVRPLRVLLYGQEGVGKSSFAASAPRPLFLGSEEGTFHLACDRIQPKDWVDTISLVRWFATTDACQYETLVFDTLDWYEPQIVEYICRRDDGMVFEGSKKPKHLLNDGKPFIEGYGYGKGWGVAVEEWRLLIAEIERARERRNVHVIFLAHSHVAKEKNLAGDDYGVIGPNMNKLAVELFLQWCDATLYAEMRKIVLEEAETNGRFKTKAKVISDGTRVMHTSSYGAHRAKNRYGLPQSMPLSWDEFYKGVEKWHSDVAEQSKTIRAEIMAKLDDLNDVSVREKTVGYLVKFGENVAKMIDVSNRLSVLLTERLTNGEERS